MTDEALPQPSHAIIIGPLDEFMKLEIKHDTALISRRFSAYAPPSTWGSWVQVATHGGIVNYSIDYEPIGETNVLGTVKYYGSGGEVTQRFNGSIAITTGNFWANVFVCFRGEPLGTAINVTINP